MRIIHPLKPIYNKESKVLILGSFPSVKSRKDDFYYANPQNRFWIVISSILNEEIPSTIEEKKKILLNNNIAVWDVIKSCSIIGSDDSTITDVEENYIGILINNSNISRIYTNGKTAKKYYDKYLYPKVLINAISLPSTSSANAFYSLDKLNDYYKNILNYIK